MPLLTLELILVYNAINWWVYGTVETFTKDDVLNRLELPMDEDIDPKYFKMEGDYPNVQFWGSDGRCYVPVRYK
jgi:hypothetical protein